MIDKYLFEEHDCPTYIVALLEHLDYELTRIMENRTQEDYPSPFQNTGNTYKNDTFEVRAYDWSIDIDDSIMPLPNFKCGDIEIEWYKYLGRGMWINRKISPTEAIEMFNKCLESLELEEKNDFI